MVLFRKKLNDRNVYKKKLVVSRKKFEYPKKRLTKGVKMIVHSFEMSTFPSPDAYSEISISFLQSIDFI